MPRLCFALLVVAVLSFGSVIAADQTPSGSPGLALMRSVPPLTPSTSRRTTRSTCYSPESQRFRKLMLPAGEDWR